ncbi:spore germination protein [Anaerobacillus alkaliphilus]|uniref:Spore germination protein n=1 Tax=Anaerobacillus alkaliphilus TaxID=1548597 RepID=A0A4Q0VS67_9BACI|nr:spore germination protein [Anaerobacillus alkaliphilus]RXI99838.1 spore germination protein [Anaerobacillus alkaliphilus]
MIKKMMKKFLSTKNSPFQNEPEQKVFHQQFNGDLQIIEQKLKQAFGNTADLIIENIQFGQKQGLLVYLNTLTDWQVISSKILLPLTEAANQQEQVFTESDWVDFGQETFSGAEHTFIKEEQKIIDDIINGQAVILIEGFISVLSIKVLSFENRGIEEPTTQTIVRGPKEGFIENIQVNLSLIRKKIKNPALRFEAFTVGSETSTSVYLAYMDGIINKKILQEIRKRLNDIQTNAIFDSGMLEEYLVDKTFTPFPLLYNTERPDTIASHLITGKFAIIVDGSPFVLTAPTTFSDFLSVSEDYYQPFLMGSFIRMIRYLSFLIALLLPSFYVAVITFHHEMIPTQLLISIITQREGIPFPAVIEALLMEITFEVLREAGIRMPRAVGGTISIVGGLVIGQAAVEAGIVSNIMVIVVALTAISSFVAPVYSFAVSTRILRFGYIILASILGLYGVFLGMIFLVAHLTSLRSFSVPYLSPIAPFKLQDHGDIFVRVPAWASKKRPSYLQTEKPSKQPDYNTPTPPKKRGGAS